MKKYLILSVVALSYQSVWAQSLLQESFGSGANQFTMDFVTIGNPGNAADTRWSLGPVGSVAYTYNLGKYEVSRDMIDKANAAGSLGITYSAHSSTANKPATAISWYEAAKFVNWLNTNQGFQAAYKFDGSGNFQLWSAGDVGYDANNLFRNSLAKYVITSRDEWYKGAYGNLNGTWNIYPTGSNGAPSHVANGTSANTAVYGQFVPADITSAGGLSPWGTMGQGGNAWEWMETAYDGINNTAGEAREQRGGYWYYTGINGFSGDLAANNRFSSNPSGNHNADGFRVASVPEPSALSLFAVGLGGLALIRRRK